MAAAAAALAIAATALSWAFVVPANAQEADPVAARPAVQSPTRSPTAFRLGEVVYVLLHFYDGVTVQGSPGLPATIGSRTVTFQHQSYASASRQALFSYRVAEGDFASGGVTFSTGTVTLSGGTFTPVSGGAATNRITLGAFGADHVNYLIDGVRPSVREARVAAVPAGGVYRPGDVVEVELRWSEPVSVPQQHVSATSVIVGIAPPSGPISRRSAVLSAGNGTDLWRFRYVVRAGDGTGVLGLFGSALALPAGVMVRDTAGNPAFIRWEAVETRLSFDAPGSDQCPECEEPPETPTVEQPAGDDPADGRPEGRPEGGGAVTTTRVSGGDRTATAVEVAEEYVRRVAAAGGDVDTVIVATSRRFADGLAASSLAGKVQAPILLTDPDRLSGTVAGFIERHEISHVYVMGGTEAVSLEAERSLEALDAVQALTRLGGADRYETSVLIAREVGIPEAFCNRNKRTVLLATGTEFADALAAAPVAAVGPHPLLLTEPDALPPKVRSYLRNSSDYGWVHNVVVVGGENAVSARVARDIAGMGLRVVRVGGADRYETAVRLAEHAVFAAASPPGRCLGNRRVGVADGTRFADALVAGPLLAYVRGTTLLVQPPDVVPPSVAAFLQGPVLDAESVELIAVGGREVLADPLLERLRAHAARRPPPPS